MKFYDCKTAPSPRRVRIFIAEKGLEIPTFEVDLRNGEQLAPDFRKLNPWCTVPVLALDDGTAICDTLSICGYLEELHPEPALMGIDAKDRAVVGTWRYHCEVDGFLPVGEVLRNTAKGLAGRALTGPHGYEQIPALGERGRKRLQHFFEMLEARLGDSEYVAGPHYTLADITAQVAVDFAGWIKMTIPEDFQNARRWHAAVSARPSAAL